MCSTTGLDLIKDGIKNHRLNRVVVASCTPATHEPLFRRACEEAGLNKYLFEMVNIREHCSWVHLNLPNDATEKAKDLIRMGVAKANLLQPQKEPELKITPTALVIGGGIAGITAALTLTRQHFHVHLVEKEPELGGVLRQLHKLHPGWRDASGVLAEAVAAIKAAGSNLTLHLSTVIEAVSGFIGNFEVKLRQAAPEKEVQIQVGTIIVATGADNLKPLGMYRYGENKNIITQLELEQLLSNGKLKKPKRVVMIQCVGAREKTGRTYCSRICCMVALNNALLLKKLYPDVEIDILFRDLQTYGEHEESYTQARLNFINFIRYDQEKPPEVQLEPDGRLTIRVYDVYLDANIEIKSDLVVLSTPLIQHEEGMKLSPILKVPLGADGFFFEAHPKLRPVDFTSDGIYVCGTAHGPKDVAESVTQAYAAASRAAIPMALGTIKSDAVKASVQKDICVNCEACEVSCIFNAIE
ncbi:MAG: CoB--CoM heterodisulfide reductase iron-sulfur subunit A family protein, partial [Candidatus Bathyarchaeota archaeon]